MAELPSSEGWGQQHEVPVTHDEASHQGYWEGTWAAHPLVCRPHRTSQGFAHHIVKKNTHQTIKDRIRGLSVLTDSGQQQLLRERTQEIKHVV